MIRIRQISVPINSNIDLKEEVSKVLRININDIKSITINKESIDARKKPNLFYIYEVDCEVLNEDKILKYNKNINVLKTPNEEYSFIPTGIKNLTNRPIVVGAGPAGLFCAYNLARYGYKPIIIERSVEPIFMGKTSFANLNLLFPDYINTSLKEGIENFSLKIKKFNMDDAILAGIESRTSSPVKIIRDENCVSIEGIYPCGEGAGYAGGITSASMDGLKVSENIMKTYKKLAK